LKKENDVLDLLSGNTKDFEKALNIKVRNGQALQAVKKTLAWVLKND
jgi:hypothetical protein